MCGIVGFVSKQSDRSSLEKMLEVQGYRGPDDRGQVVEQAESCIVHLGHNRLAIQDLSLKAHQPFVSSSGNTMIVFNGEIYNFKTIRDELRELGYHFISESDTEVILYAYEAWGVDAVEKFIGMFAFTIWDKVLQRLILVRDRAGVKPLYYYEDGDTFMFASELKSFHQHPEFKKMLNKEVLPYYFQFGYIPAPYTVFKHTHKLKPGHYLVYDLKTETCETREYWSVDRCYLQEKFDKSEAEILSELEALLSDAAELRMVSDVPVGVFLSGGYDSSLVTALLAQNKARSVNTFTIGFEDKKYNEAEYAKRIAKYFGTEHTEYYVSPKDMLQRVESLPFYYDELFGDSSALPTMMVSELAKKDVTVALSADGGDEAFCGYSKYFFLHRFAPVFSSRFQKSILESLLRIVDARQVERINALLPKSLSQTNMVDKYQKFQRAMRANSVEEMFRNASSYVDRKDLEEMLRLQAGDRFYQNFTMDDSLSLLDNMMCIDYKTFMVDDILTKVDRATMSVSLEGREPLLDHRIIEYMARVPDTLKYKDGQGKYLVRKILYKHIPPKLIDRPKTGFQVPLSQWLGGELKPLVEKYLNPSRLDSEIFNVGYVEKVKQSFDAGDTQHATIIWFILMYEMWKEKWF